MPRPARAPSQAGSSDSIEALTSMFPSTDRATLLDVLAQCKNDADRAVEHLLEMGAT